MNYSESYLEYPFFGPVQKLGPSETWVYWSKMKILLCKLGIRKFFYFVKFFDCLFKFWTLPYCPKAQWSNSQKDDFIGFKQGQFWNPYMCTFHLPYLKSGCQFMRVRPHQGRSVLRKKYFQQIFYLWTLVTSYIQKI